MRPSTIRTHPFLFLFTLFALSGTALYAAEPVWLQLDRAQRAYEDGEYGTALELVKKARADRHEETQHRLTVLKAAFAPAQVKRVGDDLKAIKAVLEARGEHEALSLLAEIEKTRYSSVYGGSAGKLIAFLENSDVFPEADYLEGLIHDAEGESSIAMRLYLAAWENRDFLDIPDRQYDILYTMGATSAGMGDRDSAERVYLQILSGDPVYGTPDEPSQTLRAMKKTLLADGDTGKFLSLYRHGNSKAFKAALRLSELYLGESGDSARASNVTVLALAMAVTEVDRGLAALGLGWDGRTLDSLFQAAASSRELSSWASSQELWIPFLLAPRVLFLGGSEEQALQILRDVERGCPDRTVRGKAAGLIRFLTPQT